MHDFLSQLAGVPMIPGLVFLNVWDCQVTVARWVALPEGFMTAEYAVNADELERDAERAVWEQGGGINLSGMYHCPPELAAQARWKEQEP